MFIANHYVKVGRTLYKKGDTIPAIPSENIDWLKRAGAITEIDPPIIVSEPEPKLEPEVMPEPTQPEIDVMEGVAEAPKKTRKRQKKVEGTK